MKTPNKNQNTAQKAVPKEKLPSKKDLILEAWQKGQRNFWQLAEDFETQPSYIASTLQSHGLIDGYHDLYTTPRNPLNVYFNEFQGKMGFKDLASAKRSVALLQNMYERFNDMHDRAGQHHCLVTGMTMYNRARFINKPAEAEIFRRWLIRRLYESEGVLGKASH